MYFSFPLCFRLRQIAEFKQEKKNNFVYEMSAFRCQPLPPSKKKFFNEKENKNMELHKIVEHFTKKKNRNKDDDKLYTKDFQHTNSHTHTFIIVY